MQTEELRSLFMLYLISIKSEERFQWNDCVRGVSRIVQERTTSNPDPHWQLAPGDITRLKHVVWDLIIGRVLIPGAPNTDGGWPLLSLTDHGRKVMAGGHPIPYDPDGYLARLQKATGGLSQSAFRYVEEALSTFRTSNYLASTVMLGAASEVLFIELCNAIVGALQDDQQRRAFGDRTAPKKNMADRVRAVTDWLSQKKTQLPPAWQNAERPALINKIADLIRDRRNEAGHPQDPPADRSHEEVYAVLVVFPDYCIKLCELKKWLEQNAGTIR